jgi:hypothetical protein
VRYARADQEDTMRNGVRNVSVRATRLSAADQGFALPTVMFMMLAAFAVVSVGILATIQTQSGTVRDQDTKSALTTAETGLNQAVFRYNAYTQLPSASQPCLRPSGTALAVASTQSTGPEAGWCAPVEGSDGSGTYSYQVCPGATSSPCNTTPGTLLVVTTGNFNGVTRRVEQTMTSSSGQSVFATQQVQTQNGIKMESSSTINANSGTNGDITMDSSAKQCGLASVGPGHHMHTTSSAKYFQNPNCSGQLDPSTTPQQTVSLPPVNQGDAATNNDNYRITNALSTASPPPMPADAIDKKKSDVVWNPNTRQLTLNSSVSLTLTGTTYSFCKLTLNSSTHLYIRAGANVNIFFDSPEACGLPANTTQMQTNSSSRITANSGTPISLAIFFVGSPNIPTNIQMNSSTEANRGCIDNFVIYAPLTDMTFNSSSYYCGALATKSLDLGSSSDIQTDAASQSFTLPNTQPHYATTKYVECTAAPASPPNSGC